MFAITNGLDKVWIWVSRGGPEVAKPPLATMLHPEFDDLARAQTVSGPTPMNPDLDSVTLNLSRAELKSLLALVYLGDWMQSANDVEAPGRDRDSVIDTVFQAAMDHGLTEYLRRDPVTGALVETPSLDAMLDPIIEEYNTQCFLDELCHRVAKAIHARKAGNTAPPPSKRESLEDLLDLENKVNALLQPDPLPGLHVLADYAEARLKLKG